MMESFLKIVGLATLLMLCACSDRVAGGSWEDTNAANGGTADDLLSSASDTPEDAFTPIGAAESSSSLERDESDSPKTNLDVMPSSSNSNDPEPTFDNNPPKERVSSSSYAMSPGPAIGATSSSALAVTVNSSNAKNGGNDSSSMAGSPPAQEIPYVETINVGSQVWMKSLGAGGAALDWNSAMAPGGCPEGFRLPTLGEADLLLHMNVDGTFADGGGEGVITGGSTRVRALGWLPANNTGNGVVDGKFWTSEEYGETGAYYFAVSAMEDDALLQGDLRTNAAYVRCIKK